MRDSTFLARDAYRLRGWVLHSRLDYRSWPDAAVELLVPESLARSPPTRRLRMIVGGLWQSRYSGAVTIAFSTQGLFARSPPPK